MNDVKCLSRGSGSLCLFDFLFKVDGEERKVKAGEIILLVKSLNILFSKIVQDIEKFAYSNKKEENLYYRRIIRVNFTKFNDLYNSGLIRQIGCAMNDF